MPPVGFEPTISAGELPQRIILIQILNKCVLKVCAEFLARNELVNTTVAHLVTPNEVMCNGLFCSAISGFGREVDGNCALLDSYMQRVVVLHYRRFGTTYRPHLLVSRIVTLEDGTGRLSSVSQRSVMNHHYRLRNDPDERRSQVIFFIII